MVSIPHRMIFITYILLSWLCTWFLFLICPLPWFLLWFYALICYCNESTHGLALICPIAMIPLWFLCPICHCHDSSYGFMLLFAIVMNPNVGLALYVTLPWFTYGQFAPFATVLYHCPCLRSLKLHVLHIRVALLDAHCPVQAHGLPCILPCYPYMLPTD